MPALLQLSLSRHPDHFLIIVLRAFGKYFGRILPMAQKRQLYLEVITFSTLGICH